MKRVAHGFTLIETMITLVIIGILTAIVLPLYQGHVTRTRLTEAFGGLISVPPSAEQFWSNNRTYVGFNNMPPDTANFRYTLAEASANTFTVSATGQGQAAGFVYTINQSGTRATASAPASFGTSSTCWVDRKGGQCTE